MFCVSVGICVWVGISFCGVTRMQPWAQLVWVLSCITKGGGFKSQSGHIPRLRVWSSVEVCTGKSSGEDSNNKGRGYWILKFLLKGIILLNYNSRSLNNFSWPLSLYQIPKDLSILTWYLHGHILDLTSFKKHKNWCSQEDRTKLHF